MNTTTRRHLRVVVTPEDAEQFPARVWQQAERAGWSTCRRCKGPIDPAGVVPERPDLHLGCECESCGAPLGQDDVQWHPQCRPFAPVRSLRVMRRSS